MTGSGAPRLRAALALILYLVVAGILAAVTAVAVVDLLPRFPEALSDALLRKGAEKVMIRSLQVWGVLLLPFLLRQLGWRGWSDMGLVSDQPGEPARPALVRVLQGLLLGLLTMAGVAGILYLLGAREPDSDGLTRLGPLFLVSAAGSALVVGLFEETLARGILFRVPARLWGVVPAALVGSVLFSLAHFLDPDPAAFEAGSFGARVMAVLASTVHRVPAPPDFWIRALNLTLLGGVLCAFVVRTGAIWFSIGAHAGWVWIIRLNSQMTAPVETGQIAWWMGRRADTTDSLWCAGLLGLLLLATVCRPRGKCAPAGKIAETAGKNTRGDFLEWWSWRWLAATVFAITFSIALGQTVGALCLLFAAAAFATRRLRVVWPDVFWPAMAFAVIAILSVALGPEPAGLFKKTGRLVWFLLIPVTAALARTKARRAVLLQAFAMGCGVLALKVCLLHPWKAWQGAGSIAMGHLSFMERLVEVGSMTDGQMLMMGVLVSAGLMMLARHRGQPVAGWGALLAAQLAGLVINFKRGSWFTALTLGVLFLAARRRWLWLAVLLGGVLAALCCEPVRGRLERLRAEWNVDGGGRLTMWVRIAPVLVREHPLGVGYRSVTPAMLRRVAPRVERDRNHLHSNPAQVLVETGWLGLLVYAGWMILVARDLARFRRATKGDAEGRLQAVSLAWMFAGLLLNGLVEYNFGDTELMIVLAVVLGAAGGAREERAP